MAIEFFCVHCGQRLTAGAAAAGQEVECFKCHDTVSVPGKARPAPQAQTQDALTFCPKCGGQNYENNFKCASCGFVLHEPPRPQYIEADDRTFGGLFPYKNTKALWAYYLIIMLIASIANY